MKRYYLLLVFLFYSSLSFANYRITSTELGFGSGNVFSSTSDMDSFFIGQCFFAYRSFNKIQRVHSWSSRHRQYYVIEQPNSSCDRDTGFVRHLNVYFESYQCPDGTELNHSTRQCELPVNQCLDLKGKNAPWPGHPPGYIPTPRIRLGCNTSNMCEYAFNYSSHDGSLIRNSFYTGEKCVGSSDDYADSPFYPEPEPEPEPEPTPDPEPEPTPDPDPQPDPTDPTKPIEPPEPEPTPQPDPEPTPTPQPVPPVTPEPLPPVTEPLPEPPSFNPQPPTPTPPINVVVPPTPTPEPPTGDNAGVIRAINATNANLSNLISLSTNKNIEGFNALNQQLASIHATNNAIGQSIVEQMKNDILIAENNQKLMQQQTEQVQAVTASVDALSMTLVESNQALSESFTDSIKNLSDEQQKALDELASRIAESNDLSNKEIIEALTAILGDDFVDSIGLAFLEASNVSSGSIVSAINQTGDAQVSAINQLNNQVAGLNNAISDLDMGACDPNKDERSCEGQHGLTSNYIQQIYDETMFAVTNVDEIETTKYLEAIAEEATSERTALLESEGRAFISLFTDSFPSAQACDFQALELTQRFRFNLTCESVELIKDILSFIFYLYTIYALMNILLDQVTPLGVPYMQRRNV